MPSSSIPLRKFTWEYQGGMSEERVGNALKGKRDQAIVTGFELPSSFRPEDLSVPPMNH